MKYVTYENHADRHLTIHVESCTQIRKHGGEHKYGQGAYNEYGSFIDASTYAKGTGFAVRSCSFCKPGQPPTQE